MFKPLAVVTTTRSVRGGYYSTTMIATAAHGTAFKCCSSTRAVTCSNPVALALQARHPSLFCWPAAHAPCTLHQQRLQPPRAQPGGLGDEDAEVAVFRFTLGIPGFDDSRVPQVVGTLVAAAVAVNHVLGVQPTPPAQVRTEFLVILLSVMCLAAPEVEARLREAAPNRGRAAAAGALPGALQTFALAPGLSEQLKVELAWSSRSLLVNANCCSVMAARGQQAIMVRGAVSEAALAQQPAGDNSQRALAAAQQDLQQPLSAEVCALMSGQQQQLFLPDAAAIKAAGLATWSWLPPATGCLLLVTLPGVPEGGLLVVAGDRARALSGKDVRWAAAMGAKLAAAMV